MTASQSVEFQAERKHNGSEPERLIGLFSVLPFGNANASLKGEKEIHL
jgi:hypothetical protein